MIKLYRKKPIVIDHGEMMFITWLCAPGYWGKQCPECEKRPPDKPLAGYCGKWWKEAVGRGVPDVPPLGEGELGELARIRRGIKE